MTAHERSRSDASCDGGSLSEPTEAKLRLKISRPRSAHVSSPSPEGRKSACCSVRAGSAGIERTRLKSDFQLVAVVFQRMAALLAHERRSAWRGWQTSERAAWMWPLSTPVTARVAVSTHSMVPSTRAAYSSEAAQRREGDGDGLCAVAPDGGVAVVVEVKRDELAVAVERHELVSSRGEGGYDERTRRLAARRLEVGFEQERSDGFSWGRFERADVLADDGCRGHGHDCVPPCCNASAVS